jgi:hypothetical protein
MMLLCVAYAFVFVLLLSILSRLFYSSSLCLVQRLSVPFTSYSCSAAALYLVTCLFYSYPLPYPLVCFILFISLFYRVVHVTMKSRNSVHSRKDRLSGYN